MDRPILQFSHANGFPAETYSALLLTLKEDFDVRYIRQFGHNFHYPIADGWGHLVHELVDELKQIGSPVIGVGHSLGGVLTLFAASLHPELFSYIVLLDPPIMNPIKGAFLYCLKKLRLHVYVMPVHQAARRRTHWPDYEEMRLYLRRRQLFDHISDEGLEDYMRYGTKQTKTGVFLLFNPAIESKIFSTLPHEYVSYQKRLIVPGTLLYGEDSNVVNWFDRKTMEICTSLNIQQVPGTHLFPLEYPQVTARLIKGMIR
jgi:pimeloyl-ACP methyl ester carboxylesterase